MGQRNLSEGPGLGDFEEAKKSSGNSVNVRVFPR